MGSRLNGVLILMVVAIAAGDHPLTAAAAAAEALALAPAPAGPRGKTVTFEKDIMPVLTRAGCNAGACHGKARGQNGFALSLLGFDASGDFAAITKEARGRRVFPAAPDQSLLLLKATAKVPHGGGRRIEPESPFYSLLLRWIQAGMPRTPADAPRLAKIKVEPSERITQREETFALKVLATYSDNHTEDVTHLAAFQSSESAVVGVDPSGQVKAGPLPGEAAISARFMGFFANCDISIPLPDPISESTYDSLPRRNFIDGLVWNKLKKLAITPSGPANDATYLRRAYLDVIGKLPTVEETRAFLADPALDKRSKLVDSLLQRPEYADHWATKWMDLLRPNPYRVGIKAVFNLDGWIRQSFRKNQPYDQFVREILTARGSTFHSGPSTIFRDRREPDEIATMVSQLFLGIRLECARCHHHPFESWDQEQFYSFASYFSRVSYRGTGLSPPISGGEEIIVSGKGKDVAHPLTGQVLAPKPLFGAAPATVKDDQADSVPNADHRDVLAQWITQDNPYFAKVMVNRVWFDLMGRGIVEPVDDLRATNPPSNAPLLDALAKDFRDHDYDLKHLIKTIMNSAVYGLSSEPNDRNVGDTRNFSRHYRQRHRAEVMLDAVSDVTESPERFEASPPGTRANAIWTHRVESLTLDTFGRPDPNQDPPCERTPDTSVVQALHLMNAPQLQNKIASENGRVARLAKSDLSPRAIVEELYLAAYSRLPTDEERAVGERLAGAKDAKTRREGLEDLLWALINTPEFVFKD